MWHLNNINTDKQNVFGYIEGTYAERDRHIDRGAKGQAADWAKNEAKEIGSSVAYILEVGSASTSDTPLPVSQSEREPFMEMFKHERT